MEVLATLWRTPTQCAPSTVSNRTTSYTAFATTEQGESYVSSAALMRMSTDMCNEMSFNEFMVLIGVVLMIIAVAGLVGWRWKQ